MQNNPKQKFGVALGGGGVRGLAHTLALREIDACGIKPSAISGTSMGAIVGAMYASGIPGDELATRVENYLIDESDSIKDKLNKTRKASKWLKVLSLDLRHGGILNTSRFLKVFGEALKVKTFEELEIPLHIVATNFWTGEQVVFSSGELLPAIHASMAIPGVFAPVVINNQVLVDGGLANNVPYDVLEALCDVVIAIDVAPQRHSNTSTPPDMTDAVIGMFDVLVEKIVANRLQQDRPDIYINTGIKDVRVLDFHKAKEVMRQAKAPIAELHKMLLPFCTEKNTQRTSRSSQQFSL